MYTSKQQTDECDIQGYFKAFEDSGTNKANSMESVNVTHGLFFCASLTRFLLHSRRWHNCVGTGHRPSIHPHECGLVAKLPVWQQNQLLPSIFMAVLSSSADAGGKFQIV